jgi:ATP-binding cassette, subfamily B, bacterial PglK
LKNNHSAWHAVLLTWQLLTPLEKKKGFFLSLGSAIVSLIDIIALIGVIPLVSLIIDPNLINTNPAITTLFLFVGEPEFKNFVYFFAIGSISLIVLSITLNLLVMWLTKIYRVACQDRLAKELVSKCVGAPYSWLLNQNSTTLTHYVSNDVLSWSSGGIHAIVAIIGHLTLLIFATIVVINFANFSGLFGIFIIGLIAASIMALIRPKITNLSLFKRTASAKSFSVASEFLGGIKDVKLSGRESTFIGNYLHKFNIYGEAMGKLKLLQAIPPLIMLLIGQSSIIIIALVLWSSGLSTGEIASQVALVLLVIGRMVPVITRLSGEFATLWNAIPNLEGIHKILDEIHLVSNHSNYVKESQSINNWKTVKLDNVSYRFENNDRMVISKLSLLIEKGKSYGIVGPTGSGKTTLIDIILGLLEPTEGLMMIDDKPLKANNIRNWQNRISYVPQNPTIMDDTLLANVCLGIPADEIDKRHASKCLIDADLSGILNELTLDGQLGEGGNWLSGGQRQRVCIARALYCRPKVLILDESTSALDILSENTIQQTLNNLDKDITLIMIAHRLSTIEYCDKIFVLDEGQIIDQGDYSFLIKNSSLFKKLALVKDL